MDHSPDDREQQEPTLLQIVMQYHLPDDPLPVVEDVEAAGFLDRTPHASESTEENRDNRGERRQ